MGVLDMVRRATGELVGSIQRMTKSAEDVLPYGWVLRDSMSAPVNGGNYEVPPTPQELFDEYHRNLWVYAAISAKSRAAANAPVVLKKVKKSGVDEVIKNHEILDLLERPSETMTWQLFCETIVTHMELGGNAFVEKVPSARNKKTAPYAELLPLLPTRMRMQVHPKKGVVKYLYSPNMTPIAYSPEEILHFRYIDPSREERGMGAMQPAWMSSKMDSASLKYNANLFVRGGVPNVVLETDKSIPPSERKRIKEEWVKMYSGVDNSGKVAVLPFGLKFTEIGNTNRDMQYDRLRQMSREEILAAFRVPPVLTGLLAGASFASAYAQLEVFRDLTLIPLMRNVLSVFNFMLVEDYPDGDQLYLDLDLAKMKFPDEADKEYGRALNSFNAFITTLDETRATMGYPPLTEEQKKEIEERQKGAQPPPPGQDPNAPPGQDPTGAGMPPGPQSLERMDVSAEGTNQEQIKAKEKAGDTTIAETNDSEVTRGSKKKARLKR